MQTPDADPVRNLAPHVIFLLIDGLGWPLDRAQRDVYAHCPALLRLFDEHGTPIDAQLEVEGIPQSATGQTTMLTGINAARRVGTHVEGFPGPQLRPVVRANNIFTQLRAKGVACTFANAYVRQPGNKLPLYLQSVTTVATLAAFGKTRNREDLLAGQALTHDITRETLAVDYDLPLIEEAEAAAQLAVLAGGHSFTLFEFFLTDRAGHRGTREDCQRVLGVLDRFLAALMTSVENTEGLCLVLTSDHGNVEAPETRRHTCNPVPWIVFGGEDAPRKTISSLVDVVPALLLCW